MEKDVFTFKDFLTDNNSVDLEAMKSKLIKEGFFNEEEDSKFESEETNVSDEEIINDIDNEINSDFNPYKRSTELVLPEDVIEDEFIEDEDTEDETEFDESISEESDFYKLYKDKSEDFTCDIAIEGVNSSDTEVRLIIESEDWTLMFKGEISKGKCIIPIKKLNIFNEGQVGNIKLEVNADGNLFTPWEDKFIIKLSKKVTVKVNEKKESPKKIVKKGVGVKVNVRKS